jgi:hypothetical protein
VLQSDVVALLRCLAKLAEDSDGNDEIWACVRGHVQELAEDGAVRVGVLRAQWGGAVVVKCAHLEGSAYGPAVHHVALVRNGAQCVSLMFFVTASADISSVAQYLDVTRT